MNKTQIKKFENLWRVKILKSLHDLEDLDGTVTRTEKNAILRDLRMMRYGFENGLRIAETTGENKDES